MSAPAVPAAASYCYDQLPDAWRARDNDTDGYLLLGLIAGLTEGFADMWSLVEDPVTFLSPDTTGAEWLTLAAAMNGGRLAASMTEAQRRAEVKNPTGWRRGLPASMREAATKYLPAGAEFLFLERRNPDVPGDEEAHTTMLVHASDVDPADADAILASFQATVPVGMFGHLLIVGQWWAEEAVAHDSWAAAATAHSTWVDLAEGD